MTIQGLDWQTIQIPFTAGLNTKAHGYALEPPGLTTCKNVEFDEVGGLRLRKPYASIGLTWIDSDGVSGGTITAADLRKIHRVGDELLLFTEDKLYSWSETLTKWVSKATHLAVSVTESTRFGNTNDQVFADRAQLSGTVAMVWAENLAGTLLCYFAAYDATTGAVLVSPTSFGAGMTRPRVVAIDTRFVVSWDDGTGINATVVTPTAAQFTTTGPTTLSTFAGQRYDIVRDPAANQAVFVVRNAAGNQYQIGTVTSALVVATSTKTQTCDELIALSCSLNDRVHVVRSIAATGVIKADLITLSTFADVTMDTTIGASAAAGATPVNQLTCAHRSTTDDGAYRCYAFWYSGETAAGAHSVFNVETNWTDTLAAAGTENNTFASGMGVASRAFNYNGSIYVWLVFAMEAGVSGGATPVVHLGLRAQFQNTYFLYRDDGALVSKATWARAGGFGYSTGHLPGVALVSGTTGFAWAGCERQIITVGGTDRTAYSARVPRDITFSFDSDAARRVVHLGRTAYVSGGLLMQYDGSGLTEVGFQQYPWHMSMTVGGGGAAAAGTYSYKTSTRWENARGEVERSTTAVGAQLTILVNEQVDIGTSRVVATHKTGVFRVPAIEVWRTKVAPTLDSPFYLVTSRDPAATGDNGYLSLGGTEALQGDIFADAILETKEQNPENGAVLPHLAPPGASIIVASDSRLFLAGVPGEPNRVHYSLLRNEHEVVAFHGALSFALPTDTGAITGLAIHDDILYVFTSTAVYAVPGEGYDNIGGGGNYGPPQLISSDVGALSHDTIASTPTGLVFFSRKGWYRIRGRDLEYIGAKVEDYNTDTWVAAQVVESQHQVRFLSSSRMLVWDYLVGEWSEWSQSGGLALARWRTYPMLLDATACKQEQSTFTSVDYGMEVVTGWIKPAQMQGMVRVRRMMVLGEYKADHAQLISIGYDYQTTPPFTDALGMGFVSLTAGNPTQVRMGPSRQRCEAIRIRVLVVAGTGSGGGLSTYPAYDAVTLTGLALEIGLRRGLYQRLPAAQKQ